MSTQWVIDWQLLALMKRRKLAPLNHGMRVVGPVRPTKMVATDVNVYDWDLMGMGIFCLGSRGREWHKRISGWLRESDGEDHADGPRVCSKLGDNYGLVISKEHRPRGTSWGGKRKRSGI